MSDYERCDNYEEECCDCNKCHEFDCKCSLMLYHKS